MTDRIRPLVRVVTLSTEPGDLVGDVNRRGGHDFAEAATRE